VLELEGLVENIAGHGVFVRQISGREVSESLEVRSALDALAVALAAERRTEEDLVHLEAALRLFDLALASGDDKRIMAADSRFHDAIYQAAHNTVLLTVRDAFALYEGFYFHPDFYRYNEDAFRRSLQRHTEMAEAIRSRQPAEAERISRQHLTEALELVREDTEAATPQEKE
jgi:DNA-binding GntR family transcriptional regulator